MNVNSNNTNNKGILANTMQGTSLSNIKVIGNISGGDNVGGVVGNFSGENNNMENVHYTGQVSSTGNNVGGIAGWIENINASIPWCTCKL